MDSLNDTNHYSSPLAGHAKPLDAYIFYYFRLLIYINSSYFNICIELTFISNVLSMEAVAWASSVEVLLGEIDWACIIDIC